MYRIVTYVFGKRHVRYIKPTIRSLSEESNFKEGTPYVGLVLALKITFFETRFCIRIVN